MATRTFLLLPLCLLACQTPEPQPAESQPGPRFTPPATSRAPTRTPSAPVQTTAAPTPVSLRTRLRTESVGKVNFSGDNGEYRDVARYIQTVTGIPVLLTPSARQVVEDEALTLELELVAPISVEALLNFMTEQSEDLVWSTRDGVVFITSRTESGDENFMDVYDVRDLTFPMTSFIPPQINQIPTESLETSDVPRTGGEAEDKVRRFEPDILVANIRDATDPDYWEGDTGASIDALETGYLVVNANAEMHLRVRSFLGQYR